jgi:prevent-host-death family protein
MMYGNRTYPTWEAPVPTTSSPIPTVGVRELGRNPSRVLAHLPTGPVIITSGGRPVAVLSGIDQDELEDFILAHAPTFVADMAAADQALTAGDTYDLEDVLAEDGE